MANELLAIGLAAWVAAAVLALSGQAARLVRALLGLGGVAILAMVLLALPNGTQPIHTVLGMGPEGAVFQIPPEALWLLGFGLAGAILAAWLGTPAPRQSMWGFGAAASLIGALGVLRFAGRGEFSRGVGDHEPGRRRDDPGRRPGRGHRAAGPVHAGAARGGCGRLDPRFPRSRRPRQQHRVQRLRRRGARHAPLGAAFRRTDAPDRVRREARAAAVLRMVSRRLWRRQRRDRCLSVRRRPQCRVLRLEPRTGGVAAGRSHAAGLDRRHFHRGHRRAERDPDRALCLPAGDPGASS